MHWVVDLTDDSDSTDKLHSWAWGSYTAWGDQENITILSFEESESSGNKVEEM